MNDLPIRQTDFNDWAMPQSQTDYNPTLWHGRWNQLLKGEGHHMVTSTKNLLAAGNNPFYAVVVATAFILRHGFFRGYEHLASVYFDPASRHYIGVTVHKERTRTHIDKGNYVTDWYVTVNDNMEANLHEQLYRGAVGMMVSAELGDIGEVSNQLIRFVIQNELNIRVKEDADQKAQITSQG